MSIRNRFSFVDISEGYDFVINTDFPEFSSARAQLAGIIETILLQHHRDLFDRYIRLGRREVSADSAVTSIPELPLKLADYYDDVAFDLDDTLAPVEHAVEQASKALLAYLQPISPRLHRLVEEGRVSREMKR